MLVHRKGPSGPEIVGGDRAGRVFRPPNLSPRTKMIVVLFFLALFSPLFFLRMMLVYVAPDQYGVKEVKIGLNRGIQKAPYTAGYAFQKPFGFEKIHLLPRTVQVLELTDYEKPATLDKSRYFTKAAKIQTSDGFYVDVDVSILYRIKDPYLVMTTLGSGMSMTSTEGRLAPRYITDGILPKAEPMLKASLGELDTEDFYNSPLRTEKAQKACELLNADLESKGMEVDHVLVRYFRYSDQIQTNIEAKKLQDQLVFKNQAEARAAMEQAKLKGITQEGASSVKVAQEEGSAYKTEKDAESELYSRKRKAEADLLVSLAKARAAELQNKAMEVAGSDLKVAMQMADVIKGMEVVMVPVGGPDGLNPLDLDSLLTMFGMQGAAAGAPAAPAPTGELPFPSIIGEMPKPDAIDPLVSTPPSGEGDPGISPETPPPALEAPVTPESTPSPSPADAVGMPAGEVVQ